MSFYFVGVYLVTYKEIKKKERKKIHCLFFRRLLTVSVFFREWISDKDTRVYIKKNLNMSTEFVKYLKFAT